jgi:hypothetical protein
MFDACDVDGSGTISYSEYIRHALRDGLMRSAARVADLFRKWDADESGTVDRLEFRRAVRALGFDAPREAVDELFRSLDLDSSGTVDYRELHRMLRQGASVTLEEGMQVGAAGAIELDTLNLNALRTGRGESRVLGRTAARPLEKGRSERGLGERALGRIEVGRRLERGRSERGRAVTSMLPDVHDEPGMGGGGSAVAAHLGARPPTSSTSGRSRSPLHRLAKASSAVGAPLLELAIASSKSRRGLVQPRPMSGVTEQRALAKELRLTFAAGARVLGEYNHDEGGVQLLVDLKHGRLVEASSRVARAHHLFKRAARTADRRGYGQVEVSSLASLHSWVNATSNPDRELTTISKLMCHPWMDEPQIEVLQVTDGTKGLMLASL